jgi:ABC-2 type transport system ATP-binding protein
MIRFDRASVEQAGQLVVEAVSLHVRGGEAWGVIGPSGAGKSLLVAAAATAVPLHAGEILVQGHSVRREAEAVRRVAGYVPDRPPDWPGLKAAEFLELFAVAAGRRGRELEQAVAKGLELAAVSGRGGDDIDTLDAGHAKRLLVARALLHDPQVLLLDEPASGLDPRARIEMRGLLKRLQGLGKTILVSSHILPELADICNRVGIIEYGRLLACGNVQDLLTQVRGRPVIRFRLAGPPEKAARLLETSPEAAGVAVRDGEILVTLADGVDDPSPLAAKLIADGHRLLSMREQEVNLETAFLELTKGAIGRPGRQAAAET